MVGQPPRALRNLWLRHVKWVHILDFAGLTKDMRQALTDRLRMVYTGAEGQINDTEMRLDTADTLCFQLGEARHCMTQSMIKGTAVSIPYLLAQYLFRHDKRRKRGARFFGEYFVGRLVDHFGLVTEEGFQELTVVVGELRMIDMDTLVPVLRLM
ncbi:hypothetical protein Tco_0091691 [Tanacetum coccineum]